jgi:hypothetical protein
MDVKDDLRAALLRYESFEFEVMPRVYERITPNYGGGWHYYRYIHGNSGYPPDLTIIYQPSELDELMARLEHTGALAIYARSRQDDA